MDQTEIKIEDGMQAEEETAQAEAGAETKAPDTGSDENTERPAEEPQESPAAEAAGGETGNPADEPEDGGTEKPSEEPEGAAEQPKEEDEELSARYMRLAADFQNYKRRVEKEKTDIYAFANEQIVTQLLDVMDNFERALEAETADEGFAEGMKMIFQQLTGVMERFGLEEIKAQGEDFDPNFHNAVLTGDDPEYGSGKVTQVMQKGYTLKGKVIRPSMVKVNN